MDEKGHRYTQTRWELTDLFPGAASEDVARAIDDMRAAVAALEAVRDSLSAGIGEDAFLDALRTDERLTAQAHRREAYGDLWFSEDTQNESALSFKARVEQLVTEAGNGVIFFTHWWKMLEEGAAHRLLACAGDLRYYLRQLRSFREHTLSEGEEKIINLKDLNGMLLIAADQS